MHGLRMYTSNTPNAPDRRPATHATKVSARNARREYLTKDAVKIGTQSFIAYI